MPLSNYLRFNADSVTAAIKRKLSENSSFTDQMYPGSDLSIIIETLAYMFELQSFYLNNTGTEAVFSDAKLYENMNRIVKLIGYNPVGHLPSQVVLIAKNKTGITNLFSDQTKYLPKYSYINTNLTDSYGKPITYTFSEHLDINSINDDTNYTIYNSINGKWKLLNTTLVAYGTPNESFTLNRLDLSNTFVGHNYIDVYVKRFENGVYTYKQFTPLATGYTFGNSSTIIGATDQVFELRINENKKYELVFGDGIHGMLLQKNDELYIVYLETNGEDGAIGANIISDKNNITIGIDGLSREMLYNFLNVDVTNYSDSYINDNGANNELARFYFINPKASTKFTEMETVDDIRTNAPIWFKTGGVLLQENDYKTWMLSGNYKSLFYDVNVMNNEKYIKEFMGWLNNYNKLSINIRKNNYFYADACDFNAIYIWVKQKYDIDLDPIYEDLDKRKVLTSKPIILNSVETYFTPGLFYEINDSRVTNGVYYTKGVYKSSDGSYFVQDEKLQDNADNWIEIIKDKTSYVSSEKIKQNVITQIKNFFEPQNNKLGQVVNINDLYINLINIPGVKNVRTCFRNVVNNRPLSETYYYNGLSFLVYTKKVVNGADIQIAQGSFKLENFQFPQLAFSSYLTNKVIVISESNQSNISI